MNNNFFEVLRAGINTTFQDKGRFGMQHLGVAPSGCMDDKLFLIANSLVSNNENEGEPDGEEELEELLRHALWLPAEKCLELGLADSIL